MIASCHLGYCIGRSVESENDDSICLGSRRYRDRPNTAHHDHRYRGHPVSPNSCKCKDKLAGDLGRVGLGFFGAEVRVAKSQLKLSLPILVIAYVHVLYSHITS